MRAIRPLLRSLLFLSAAFCAFSLAAMAQSQAPASSDDSSANSASLGDLARQQRSTPHPKSKRVINEENFAPSEAAFSQSAMDSVGTKDTKDEKGEKQKASSDEDKEKERAKPFIEAVQAQKKRIAEAEKKIQQLKDERRQRASAQYSDLGVLLRDPQKWNNDEKEIQGQIDDNQKEIDDAKSKLEDAREQARKNGVRLPE